MQPSSSETLFSLATAVDHRPLTVEAGTPVSHAVDILAEARASCPLPGLELSLNTVLTTQARGSSIWVVEQGRLLGYLTEAEALPLIVAGKADQRAITSVMATPPAALTRSTTAGDLDDILTALVSCRQHQIHHLPVLDEQGRLLGVIHPEGIRSALPLDHLLKTVSLSDVVRSHLITAPPQTSALDLAHQMADHQQDTILIATDHHFLGLVSRPDILQLRRLGLNLADITAALIMETPLLQLSPDQSALQGYWTMQQQQTQRFSVADACSPLGLATPTSFLYTLPLEQIRQASIDIQQSVAEFAHTASIGPRPSPPAAEPPTDQLECSRLLSTMALHIRESLDLDTILQTAVDEVRQFLRCDRVLIYQFNADMSGTVVVESVASGWHPALNSTVRDTCFGQNYAQAYKEGRTQIVDDIYAAGLSQCHIDILTLFDVRASLVVPILQGNHLWGLLCAYHCATPRHWHTFEVDLLQQLATHMAIAIQQSELYRQIQSELRDRQQAETELKASLKEKESLLKEIHHRVKNNLQIISSVLRLQSDYVYDDKVLALFQDSQHRIRSMALIHEKLYKSRDLTRISMDEYIKDLATSLLSSQRAIAHNVQLNIHAEEICLNIDTAIPCGLIINELVSNALKHAFPTASPNPSQVQVEMCRQDPSLYTLTVRDNGVGLPPNLDFRNTESLGLELVCVFTEQLGGTIELDSYDGTSFTVTFEELESAEGGM